MELKVKIKKSFGNFHLDADFETDSPMALLGASGSGKSVTLKCIAGIERPDSGIVVLNGRTLFDSERKINIPPQKRNVGYLFQNYALFPNMTVRKNIEVGAKKNYEDIDGLLRDFYIEDVKDKYPWKISGGQQQRTALARIIASRPDILLLDEPFSAIDTYLRWQLEMTSSDIIKKFGGLYVMVTHDRGEAYRNCDRICIIDNGRTEGILLRNEFIQNPISAGAARISGCKNIFACERTETDGLVYVPQLGVKFEVSPKCGFNFIGIRDNAFDFDEDHNKMECEIERVIYDIFSTIIMLRPLKGGALLRVETKNDAAAGFKAGDRISVGVRPENILLLK